MSLLMEALRKAEQGKKKAAEVDSPPEPLDRGTDSDQQVPSELRPSLENDEDTITCLEIPEPGPLVIEREEETTEPVPEDTFGKLDIWETGEEGTEITLVEESTPSDSSTVEKDEEEATSVPAMESPAEKPSHASDMPAPALELQNASNIPIAPVIPTTSASVEASKRAARAVFIAKNKHRRQTRKRQMLFMAGAIGVVLLGVAGFMFFPHQIAMNFPTPIATGKKTAPPSEPPLPQKESAAGSVKAAAPSLADMEKKSPVSNGPGPSEQKSSSEKMSPPVQTGDALPHDTAVSPQTPDAKAQSTAVAESSPPPIPVSTSESLSRQDFPNASQDEEKPVLPSDYKTPSQPVIQITHHAAQPRINPLLARAYAAYQRGEFEQSRHAYQQILQSDPEDRGALLGLAALALRSKETGRARYLYLRLLERDPSDPLARVGLMAVMPTGDPVRLESELKLLLDVHPNLAPLSFSLGNLYAAGKRWGEAQQAYFNALQAAGKAAPQMEMVSPDYPYNLAVSLEHLNQSELAVKYYKEALKLAVDHPAGFNREALRHRLKNFNQMKTQ